ncbi:MAG TPA: hypothetical protein VK012_07110 [Gemmatimonadales bacterium]|nr:hypothetical protein [Gemmatimonadales bacterium]
MAQRNRDVEEYHIQFRDGHLFLDLDGRLWLVDTGAPTSFGAGAAPEILGQSFEVGSGYGGLDAAELSRLVGVECAGLLGADVLNEHDFIFDPVAGTATLSRNELAHAGTALPLEEFMGIPILGVQVQDEACRTFFDTGAQISYLRADLLAGFPEVGRVRDFYPGFGEFETETHSVTIGLGGTDHTLRCGSLPQLLSMTLSLASTAGIIGNELLKERVTGYFPRRRQLVI